jgi:transposase-like protein
VLTISDADQGGHHGQATQDVAFPTETGDRFAALRDDQSIAELARQHGIREPLIDRWKSDFLEAGPQALRGAQALKADEALKQENDQLKKLLGEKALELDILKKWSSL